MVYRYCWHNYMVWGGYRNFRRRGGGKPKKGPTKKTQQIAPPPPPHGKKCSPYREKCSKKPPTLRKSSKDALYKDKKGPQMEKNVAKRPPHGKKCSQYNHYAEKNVAKRPPHGKKVRIIVII